METVEERNSVSCAVKYGQILYEKESRKKKKKEKKMKF